jgi:rubrerythrin
MPIDFGSVAAVLGSLKTAQTMASGLLGLRDEAMIQAKVIELNQVIIDAQSGALAAQENEAALREEIRALKRQIADYETWAARAENYELKELHPGSFAYILKEGIAQSETVHYLCATCFEDKKAIPLQGRTSGYGNRTLSCPVCGTSVTHSQGGQPQVRTSRSNWSPFD